MPNIIEITDFSETLFSNEQADLKAIVLENEAEIFGRERVNEGVALSTDEELRRAVRRSLPARSLPFSGWGDSIRAR